MDGYKIRKPQGFEAGAGIEPANRGFADPGLTTWLPRRPFRRWPLSGALRECQFSTLNDLAPLNELVN